MPYVKGHIMSDIRCLWVESRELKIFHKNMSILCPRFIAFKFFGLAQVVTIS